MDDHESLLTGLNKEQCEAVIAPHDCHLLILAGAGCGKTTVLTRRIAYCAASGIPLSSVLALTFTRKAADEMAERVAGLTGTTERSDRKPTITTFHAFALKVLGSTFEGQVNFHRIGFSGTPRCLDEAERIRLLAECSSSDERRRLQCDIMALDGLLARYHLDHLVAETLPEADGKLLCLIAQRIRQRKHQSGAWDFTDLVEGLVELFSRETMVADSIRKRYRTILVDEFQDTNPLQVRLLHQLLADGKRLFAVGDDDQAIYGFRGADIRPTIEFCTHFPGARILKLQTNYRSQPAILKKANRIFRGKDPAYRKVLVSGRYPPRSGITPSVHRFEDQERMVHWIMQTARQCAVHLDVPLDRIAVLVRTNQSADHIQEILKGIKGADTMCPQVLTVHKSKGLEFPVVFCADMEESVFPGYRKPPGQRIGSFFDLIRYVSGSAGKSPIGDLEEEIRLFYVAVTRAQQRLFLLYCRSKQVYGRTRRFEPSRFLRYMR